MTFTENNKWAASGAIAGAALLVFNPLTYWLVDTIFASKGWIAGNKGMCPTYLGLFIHVIVLFFAVYGLLCIDWACQ